MSAELSKQALENGKKVIQGMFGNASKAVEAVSNMRLTSNMTDQQLLKATEKFVGGKEVSEKLGKKLEKAAINGAKKGMSQEAIEKVKDNMVGKAVAKNDPFYKFGNNLTEGYRKTFNSLKQGNDLKTGLKAGFTKKLENGERAIDMGKVAGATFTAGVAGRVASGGGIYRDRYGRVNVPGVPFI